MISIVIADPCELIRVGVTAILSQSLDFRLVGSAGTGRQAVEFAARCKPKVVMLETSMPDGSIQPILHDIRTASQASRLLFFSAYVDQPALRATISGEADGYLLKEANADELTRAIRQIAEGRPYLDPSLAEVIFEAMRAGGAAHAPTGRPRLSDQERKVIACLADGKTNKEIANLLGLSEKTVRNYLSHAYDKLDFHRRSEAAAWYVTQCMNGVCPPTHPDAADRGWAPRCGFKKLTPLVD